MTVSEIRKAYLDFFASKGHTILPSSSLVPENDPTTLFTGSGMQPMIAYLLGQPHPLGRRLADSQKCFRAQDIEEVGDNRHTTFFEMLGNWSLGDYFKQKQIPWIFEFLTRELGLDPSRLFVTVFGGSESAEIAKDEDAAAIWQQVFATCGMEAKIVEDAEQQGMKDGRIFYYGEKKNWWSRSGTPDKMPVGEPGGPDSELFWDFGAERQLHKRSPWADQPCHVNCDCGRFLEIGNSVFMQVLKTEGGFAPLPNKNVDFGGGLERMAAAVMNNPDVFHIDVFSAAREQIERGSRIRYGFDENTTLSFRVILDHLRAATFLIADGVGPSNKDQGYFVRRLIRRSVRHGSKLGLTAGWTSGVARTFVETYAEAYPELARQASRIESELTTEEEKFAKTLAKGEREFQRAFDQQGSISGERAFQLYSTYGFPLELTEEMVRERGGKVDHQIFKREFERHQELSRAGSQQKFAGGLADHSVETVRLHTATHLLHQALRSVLGDHVEQKGSNITSERLRFDFSHPEKVTSDQLVRVEAMVNDAIAKALPVHFEMLDLEETKQRGAIGLFEDTYASVGGKLKVYFVGDEVLGFASREVCGGPHVENTRELGHFSLIKEEAVSAGIRRIKAKLDTQVASA